MDDLTSIIDLCPNSNIKPKPFFESREAYEKWEEQFYKSVGPKLEESARKHQESEEATRLHFITA